MKIVGGKEGAVTGLYLCIWEKHMDQALPYFPSSPRSTGEVIECLRVASQLLQSCLAGGDSEGAAKGKVKRAKESFSWKPSAEPCAISQTFLIVCTALMMLFPGCCPRKADVW